MALIAAPPVVAQPAPLSKVAAKSCQGCSAAVQPKMPKAARSAPARVTAGTPQRR